MNAQASTDPRTRLPGAALWDVRERPGEIPDFAISTRPGSHVIAVTRPRAVDYTGLGLRAAGFEVRDTIVWHHPDGNRLILLARTPMTGTTIDNVVRFGVGALNIDACRVPLADADREASEAKNQHQKFGTGPRVNKVYGQDHRDIPDWSGALGRFPTNVIFQHARGCTPKGIGIMPGDTRGGAAQVKGRRDGGFVNTGAAKGDGAPNGTLYPDAAVTLWACAADCPVGTLDQTSGASASKVGGVSRYFPRFVTDEQVWAWLTALVCPPAVPVLTNVAAVAQALDV